MDLNQFNTEKQGNYASLVYRMEPQELYDSLEKGMLENNHIEGILPISFAQMDDDRYIRYNISNLITLEDYIKGNVTKKTFLNIILSILNTLEEAEEYLISVSHLLIMEQYIYVDTTNSRALMVCLPTEGENAWNMSEFFRQMILRANYSTAEGNDYVLYLLRHFNGEADSFNAKVFKEIVKALVKNSKEVAGGQSQAVSPMQMGNVATASQGTMSMPTMQTANTDGIRIENQRNENAKKSGWGFLGGQKNQQPDIPKPGAEVKPQPMPARSTVPPANSQGAQGGAPIPPVPGQRAQGGAPIPPVPGQRAQGGAPVPPVPGQQQQPRVEQAESGKKGFFDKLIGKKEKNIAESPMMNQPAAQNPYYPQQVQAQPYVSPVNDGKTVVLGADDLQATVMLTEDIQQRAYLVRKATGERISIAGSSFTIGRDSNQADYVVSNNPAIGRCHARIVCSGGRYYFIDNNSKNSSYINGIKVAGMQQTELNSGTAIRLANEEFEFIV